MNNPINRAIICPILVGRQQPLEKLVQLALKAYVGQGQSTFISGEAGIGKSRLLTEVLARVVASNPRPPLILHGRCFQGDQSLPYAPLLDLFHSFFDLRQPSPPQLVELFVHITPGLHKLLPQLPPNNDIHSAETLSPEQEKRLLWQALLNFFFNLAHQQPLVLVIEDLHWGDEATLEFLLYFARRLLTQPILLLMSYRSEEVGRELKRLLAQCDKERLAHEEYLTPLDGTAVATFIQSIFELNRPIPADFLDALYQLTEGNPFFLEEILKSLTLTGDIIYREDGWQRKTLDQLHIPRTVQVAVQNRTDQLSEASRQLIVLAAVSGRRFDFTLLQILTRLDERSLLESIKELIQAQLVVEVSADRYAFRHALTQQAVYADLLSRERRALHRQIAVELEKRQLTSNGNGSLSDLVYHYYKAEVWSKVVEYGQVVGDAAMSLYSPRAAITYYSWVIEALGHLGQNANPTLFEVRGKAHEWVSEFEAAHEDYNCELEAAHQLADRTKEWQSLINLGALWRGRDYTRSKNYLESATALAREIGDPALLGLSLNLMGNWVLNSNQPFEARNYHQEAMLIFQELNDQTGLAITLDFLGVASLISGNLTVATKYYQQATTLFRKLDKRQQLISSLTMLSLRGPNYLSLLLIPATSTIAEALQNGEEALKLSREIGDSSGEALAQSIMVACLGLQGQYTTTLQYGHTSLMLSTQIEHPQWISFANWALGVSYLDLLEFASAQQYLEQALNQAQQMGVLFLIHLMQGFLASALIAGGEIAQAEKLLQTAPDPDTELLSRNSGWLLPLSVLVKAHLELALAKKDPLKALKIIEKWKSELPDLGPGSVIPALWLYHSQALAATGFLAEGEALLQAALEAARSQGSQALCWRILLSLGKLYQIQNLTIQAEASLSQAWDLLEALAKPLTEEGLGERFLANARKLFPPTVLAAPLTPRQAFKQAFDGLTERERTVAVMLAKGHSNRWIAEELTLSERTVDKHVENIKLKLGLNSRTQIALWAAEKGLINSPKI